MTHRLLLATLGSSLASWLLCSCASGPAPLRREEPAPSCEAQTDLEFVECPALDHAARERMRLRLTETGFDPSHVDLERCLVVDPSPFRLLLDFGDTIDDVRRDDDHYVVTRFLIDRQAFTGDPSESYLPADEARTLTARIDHRAVETALVEAQALLGITEGHTVTSGADADANADADAGDTSPDDVYLHLEVQAQRGVAVSAWGAQNNRCAHAALHAAMRTLAASWVDRLHPAGSSSQRTRRLLDDAEACRRTLRRAEPVAPPLCATARQLEAAASASGATGAHLEGAEAGGD